MAFIKYTNVINDAQLRVSASRIASRQMVKVLDYTYLQAYRYASGGTYSRTNNLARSLTKVGPISTGTQVLAYLVCDPAVAPYAASVERGASVHNIFPRTAPYRFRFYNRARPQLKFFWHGRVVYTPHVPMSPTKIGRSHPGQKGKRFLVKACERAALRYRMEIIVYPH